MKALGVLTVVAGLLAGPGQAAEGEACPYQPAILSLTNSIIEKRDELTGFPQRNYGTTAAYLAIRYTPLADAEAEALLARLIEGRARGIRELAFAWSYGKENGQTTARLLGETALADVIDVADISSIRAMIDAGAAEQLIAAVSGDQALRVYSSMLIAVIDAPDTVKRSLAALAVSRGRPELAAALVAVQSKAKAWTAFLKELNDPELAQKVTELWRWTPAMVGNPELPRTAGMNPPSNPAVRETFHNLMIVAAREPQFDFLNTLVNQSGRIEEVAAAASAVQVAYDRGEFSRDGLYGPAWLIAYRALRDVWDDTAVLESLLNSFEVATGTAGRSTPLKLLDILIAVEALRPYLEGEVDQPPTVPAELSLDFEAQWPHWIEVAAKVKSDPSDPSLAAEDTLPIAAELLLAAGRPDVVAAAVDGSPASSALLNLASDVVIRLDRLCARYLAHPAEAVLLNGQPIFKF